ncbi:MAG: hypothetical protein AB1742_06840 [bacterium]
MEKRTDPGEGGAGGAEKEEKKLLYVAEQVLLFTGVVAFLFGFWYTVVWVIKNVLQKGGW